MTVDAAAAFGEYVDLRDGRWSRSGRPGPARRAATSPADVITILVGADEDGVLESSDELTHDELTMFLVVLLVAGNETTRNAISGGMCGPHRFPDQWERLRRRARALRHHGRRDRPLREPGDQLRPYGHRGHRGRRRSGSPKGEKLLLLYQSANRDEDVFEEPDTLRLDRTPNPHLAFGVGPHVCMGINLARLEIRVLFEELVRRFPRHARGPRGRARLRGARPGARHRVAAGRLHARRCLTGPRPPTGWVDQSEPCPSVDSR